MPKTEKYSVNQFEPAHEEKLIAATTNSGAKEELNTRVLHGRDLQKVAAFSISTKGLGLLRWLASPFVEQTQGQQMF